MTKCSAAELQRKSQEFVPRVRRSSTEKAMPHEFPGRMNYSFVRMHFNEWLPSDDEILYLSLHFGHHHFEFKLRVRTYKSFVTKHVFVARGSL